jgi:hypothetical protein
VEPKYEEPKYEEPKYEKPVYKKPAYKEPVYEEPKYQSAPKYERAYEHHYETPKVYYQAPKPTYHPPKYQIAAYYQPYTPRYHSLYKTPFYEKASYTAPKYQADYGTSKNDKLLSQLRLPSWYSDRYADYSCKDCGTSYQADGTLVEDHTGYDLAKTGHGYGYGSDYAKDCSYGCGCGDYTSDCDSCGCKDGYGKAKKTTLVKPTWGHNYGFHGYDYGKKY